MPLGGGYSVEKQVTGKEDVGGIQMEIMPAYDKGVQIASMLEYNVGGRPKPVPAVHGIDVTWSP
jgi:hypothetical protein